MNTLLKCAIYGTVTCVVGTAGIVALTLHKVKNDSNEIKLLYLENGLLRIENSILKRKIENLEN